MKRSPYILQKNIAPFLDSAYTLKDRVRYEREREFRRERGSGWDVPILGFVWRGKESWVHSQQLASYNAGGTWKKFPTRKAAADDLWASVKPCTATINHGPGHQSTSTCEKRGKHRQHSARGGEFVWKGRQASSGFFNESPEEDE